MFIHNVLLILATVRIAYFACRFMSKIYLFTSTIFVSSRSGLLTEWCGLFWWFYFSLWRTSNECSCANDSQTVSDDVCVAFALHTSEWVFSVLQKYNLSWLTSAFRFSLPLFSFRSVVFIPQVRKHFPIVYRFSFVLLLFDCLLAFTHGCLCFSLRSTDVCHLLRKPKYTHRST